MLYYNIGLYTLVFGMCYLTIPLYRVFCESVGLEGDLAQKDYSVDPEKAKKINVFKKFKVIFEADVDEEVDWTFEPIQSEVIVNAGETALAFYKVKNNEDFPVIGIWYFWWKGSAHIQYFQKKQHYISAKSSAFVSISRWSNQKKNSSFRYSFTLNPKYKMIVFYKELKMSPLFTGIPNNQL